MTRPDSPSPPDFAVNTRGSAVTEHLVLVALVAVFGAAGLVGLGAAVGRDLRGDATPRTMRAGVAVSAQAGMAGALERLADASESAAVVSAAKVAARGEGAVDLASTAASVFGENAATAPVVDAWHRLLSEASEGHAVMASSLAEAAAPLLDGDGLARLLHHARATDLRVAVEYERLSVAPFRAMLNAVLPGFDPERRVSLLESLLDMEAKAHQRDIRAIAQRAHASDFDALVSHPDWGIRCDLAERPDVTPEILSKLAKDSEGFVRRAVASHVTTPKQALEILAADSDAFVRETAKQRLAAGDFRESFHPGPTSASAQVATEAASLAMLAHVSKTIAAVERGATLKPDALRWSDLPRFAPLIATEAEREGPIGSRIIAGVVEETGIAGGKYVVPNETYHAVVRGASARASGDGRGVAISVGTFRAIEHAGFGTFGATIALDYDSGATQFTEGNLALIKESRSRHEWLARLVGRSLDGITVPDTASLSRADAFAQDRSFMEALRKASHSPAPAAVAAYSNGIFDVMWRFVADQKSWSDSIFGSDQVFERVQHEAREGRILAINGSLAGKQTVSSLADVLRDHGQEVAVLDLSNAHQHLQQLRLENEAKKTLAALPFSKDAVVIFTTGGGHGGWHYMAAPAREFFAVWNQGIDPATRFTPIRF